MTNFSDALPPPQSDLAKEIVRDPYNFDFLTLREPIAERELEEGLLAHIRKFLLELGAGFAFVGQQVHLLIHASRAAIRGPYLLARSRTTAGHRHAQTVTRVRLSKAR